MQSIWQWHCKCVLSLIAGSVLTADSTCKRKTMGGYQWLSENYQPGDRIFLFGEWLDGMTRKSDSDDARSRRTQGSLEAHTKLVLSPV